MIFALHLFGSVDAFESALKKAYFKVLQVLGCAGCRVNH